MGFSLLGHYQAQFLISLSVFRCYIRNLERCGSYRQLELLRMLSGQLFLVSKIPDCVSKTLVWPPFGCVMDFIHLKQSALRFKFQVSVKRRPSSSLSLTNLSTRVYSLEKRLSSHAAVASCYLEANSYECHALSGKDFLYEEDEEDGDDENELVSDTEMLRRKRIGLANKGKIPWNKGIAHNEATRQKIKQRTIAALSNPKVRKKMSECYRDRSEQCKAKISVSLRHVWAKRLNYPRQREKFYLSWFKGIAIAAKKGGKDQKELEWDSYNKICEDLALQKQLQALDEAKEKVKAVLRAKRNAKNKTDRLSVLAQNGSGYGIEDKPRKKIGRKKCSKISCDEIVAPEELKLQTRLSKIQLKKPATITIKAETHSSLAWENLDLDYFKRENRQTNVSLADQIRAAKNIRKKLMSSQIQEAHPLGHDPL